MLWFSGEGDRKVVGSNLSNSVLGGSTRLNASTWFAYQLLQMIGMAVLTIRQTRQSVKSLREP